MNYDVTTLLAEPMSKQSSQEIISDTTKYLTEWEKIKQKSPEHKDIVLVLGYTGTWKTTLVRFLTNNNLVAKKTKDGLRLKIVKKKGKDTQPETTPDSDKSEAFTSDTFYPKFKSDSTNNIIYCDCPGFNDTRSFAESIAISVFLKEVAASADKVKIILVANYSDIINSGRAGNFPTLVDNFSNFAKNVTGLKEGVHLVVSRVKNEFNLGDDSTTKFYSDNQILENIKIGLNSFLGTIKDPDKRPLFFDEIISKNRISLFREPLKEGDLLEMSLSIGGQSIKIFEEERKNIISNTQSSAFVDSRKFGFSYNLNADRTLEAIKVAQDLKNRIEKGISSLLNNIKEYYSNLITNSKDIYDTKKILDNDLKEWEKVKNDKAETFLTNFVRKIKELNLIIPNDINKDFDGFKFLISLQDISNNQVTSDLNLSNYQSFCEDLNKFIQWQQVLIRIIELTLDESFINAISSDNIKIDTLLSISAVTSILKENLGNNYSLSENQRKELKLLFDTLLDKTVFEINDDTLTISGSIVQLSQLKPKIKDYFANTKGLKTVEIFTSKAVIIKDTELTLNSINFSIVAPEWYIFGGNHIVLNGIDQTSYPQDKDKAANVEHPATGSNGVDGLPGLPGYSAGNFLGLGNKFYNETGLVVTAKGGKGGIGQGGANGTDGAKGNSAPQDATDHGTLITEGEKDVSSNYDTRKVDIYELKGQPGQVGGNAGKGGIGGKGGGAGLINILNFNDIVSGITIRVGEGEKGESGNAGSAANGGQYGDTARFECETKGVMAHTIGGGLGGPPIFIPASDGAPRWSFKEFVENKDTSPKGIIPNDHNDNNISNPEKISFVWHKPLVNYKDKMLTNLGNKYQKYRIENFFMALDKAIITQKSNALNISSSSLPSSSMAQPLVSYSLRRAEVPQPSVLHNDLISDKAAGYQVFVDELTAYERNYFNLHSQVDFLQPYENLLTRVKAFAEYVPINDNTVILILNYLYSSILSRINQLNSLDDNLLVTNITDFIGVIKRHITTLSKLQRLETIKCYNEEYINNNIESQIKEAISFVSEIQKEIDDCTKTIGEDVNKLIDEVIILVEKSKTNIDELQKEKTKLQSALALKMMFGGLSLFGKMLSFVGPQAQLAGNVLDSAANIGEGFVYNGKDGKTKLTDAPEGVTKMVDAYKKYSNSLKEQEIKELRDQMKPIDQSINEYGGKLDDIRDRKHQLEFNIQWLDDVLRKGELNDVQISNCQKSRKQLESDLRGELDKEKSIIKDKIATADEKEKETLKKIEKAERVLNVAKAGIDIYEKYKSSEEAIAQVDEAISKEQETINKLNIFKDNIYTYNNNTLNEMRTSITQLEGSLANKSHVALDISQWKIQTTLKDMQSQLGKMTQGFEVRDDILYIFDKLNNAIQTLVHIYDRIQDYQDKAQLANYIANITNASQADNLPAQLNDLRIIILRNLILERYSLLVSAVKQWSFPFAYKFLNDLSLFSNVNVKTNVDATAQQAVKAIEDIEINIKAYESSITKMDSSIISTVYNSTNVSTLPFCIWHGSDNIAKFQDLLKGKSIILEADLEKFGLPNQSATKLNTISINISYSEPQLQSSFKEALKHFDVTLIHGVTSYYKYANQKYVICNQPLEVYFSIEESHVGNPLRKSESYNKLSEGLCMLSPYSSWMLTITPSNINIIGFDAFNSYDISKINIELVGSGSYIDESAIKDDIKNILHVDKYYSNLKNRNYAPTIFGLADSLSDKSSLPSPSAEARPHI